MYVGRLQIGRSAVSHPSSAFRGKKTDWGISLPRPGELRVTHFQVDVV